MPTRVTISNGERIIVDTKDAPRVREHKWFAVQNGSSVVIRRNVPGRNRGSQALHALLMRAPKGTVVIHLNGDPYDCRRENLKVGNPGAGQAARKNTSSAGFSSPYYGVSWNARTGKWQVVMRVDGRPKWIGSFVDELDAAEAYDKAARKVHGRRALLNFE